MTNTRNKVILTGNHAPLLAKSRKNRERTICLPGFLLSDLPDSGEIVLRHKYWSRWAWEWIELSPADRGEGEYGCRKSNREPLSRRRAGALFRPGEISRGERLC